MKARLYLLNLWMILQIVLKSVSLCKNFRLCFKGFVGEDNQFFLDEEICLRTQKNVIFLIILECNSYILGCAKCETSEIDIETQEIQLICTACDYNYFLITIDEYSYCAMNCSHEGREYIDNSQTQACEGNKT